LSEEPEDGYDLIADEDIRGSVEAVQDFWRGRIYTTAQVRRELGLE
jgi:hypothetical protein